MMFNEEDQDMKDQVVPQIPLETPLSPMNHHAIYQMREEVPNMPNHHTPILFLRNPLTLDMHQNTEKNTNRGAYNSNFMNNMCALIEWNNPTILALTETRMEDHDNLLTALGFTDKSSEVTIEPFVLTEQEIHTTIEVSTTFPKWHISIGYAKNSYNHRKILWENLRNITTSITRPWLVCGDFNEVTNALEKLGGRPSNNTKCSAFINCLDDMNMIDLDRFLSNHEWLNPFPNSTVHHLLPRTHSDHCPVLLNCAKSINKPNKIFRFESMWLRHPDFSNVVTKA
ncbi:hypothetical protein R3W88_007682 [Solanum pinnatisectum]|uniref:Endonuclease/exonuclease/phosphatase domain-containing protein n=1 Tax=Solanum pinnatisectum TaxID=50273 RepID=A0AAV9M5V5_9SOLN|nr:hypothetical protein R3W88_007682 [Solanum pinnatisectum]